MIRFAMRLAMPVLLALLIVCRSAEFKQGFYVDGNGPELEEKLASVSRTRQTWADFLPVQDPVNIYLRDRKELPPALYDSESGWIALDPYMPVESFRHEVVHRLLDLNQKSKEYWFQEGTALLLEANADASCGAALRLPPSVVAVLEESLPALPPWENRADLGSDEEARELRSSAAAFFHFLWKQKEFRGFINEQDPASYDGRHRKDFEQYLRFGEYRRLLPGC